MADRSQQSKFVQSDRPKRLLQRVRSQGTFRFARSPKAEAEPRLPLRSLEENGIRPSWTAQGSLSRQLQVTQT